MNTTTKQTDADLALSLSGIHTRVGQYHILHGVDFTVPRNQVTMLLGRNGAGKTSTMRTIMGLWQASEGQIELNGQRIETLATMEIARLGIHYVPENMGIFAGLTVSENLRLALKSKRFDQDRLAWLFDLFPAIEKFWEWPAGHLSGGQKQMLAIARAVLEPCQLLLVDEPSKGLAPAIIENLITAFKELKANDTTILMVEQNFKMAAELGDHLAVMDDGRIVYEDAMSHFLNDPEKQSQLLGLAPEVAA